MKIEQIKIGKFRFRQKIACYDYDYTLVKPKSKSLLPMDKDDWQWLRDTVPEKLKENYKKKFCIIIFTNQSKNWKIEQIVEVLTTLEIPILINVGTDKESKKPNPEMFKRAVNKKWDTKKSYYVGDALGRTTDWSDVDKVFAENSKINYKSPEEEFSFTKTESNELKEKTTQEIIIMVGYPGSGKSTIAETVFKNYKILSGDKLKTSAKMIKEAIKYLKEGLSVVFDATNGTKKKREEYINVGKEMDIPIRCVYVSTSLEEAIYRNSLREHKVPKIVYNVYKSRFEKPEENEGFELVEL